MLCATTVLFGPGRQLPSSTVQQYPVLQTLDILTVLCIAHQQHTLKMFAVAAADHNSWRLSYGRSCHMMYRSSTNYLQKNEYLSVSHS